MSEQLSHLDSEGRARMVDVSAKADTTRVAVAAGELRTTAEVVRLVRADDMPKADVLATARIAGIAGAKKTSELIPLCHQLSLSSVRVNFGFTADAITIEATAKTKGPTGVEMEALTAVAVAGLTLHDMVKAVDPAAELTGVRLLTKDGGKRGHWERGQDDAPEHRAAPGDPAEHSHAHHPTGGEPDVRRDGSPEGSRTAVVVVASTGAAAGTRVDKTGPVLVDWLTGQGFSVRGPLVYADAEIAAGLADALTGAPGLIITTGGTGASPTDATPEATLAVLDRELPGVAETIRLRGTATFPLAALSRGVAGLAGRTVIVNLPGSPGGVRDGIAVLEPLLDHLLAQVAGGGSHD
ncbi:bifunctional molybdenum cofactor biosynthesis protein MoaC/MoaB [Nocardia sp. CDC159]|uniref:Cyclic pyranopterin monophosphate synthase n=1 Tax=Nocardia pulmonis TaxID=2951408 RepID=A0A9X2E978_9NOCA|nr:MULTISPECIES: bifunctional molybdenum cofactor biosynthesis protein MoaC/MoaB [Nocardia]MCM6776462.1 bifunctional molybdenum cofactor biosynthesis protein MoaC/MoaB [Nocardia pulmonis]MCM6788886.1 bifunctional molybdenum cofactor biosynthesis protein MoaC/MoaB [Nocardia sp. CDC159]